MPSPRHPPHLRRDIARSIDLTPDLLPVLGPLFAGLHSLGSSPRRIASFVTQFAVGRFSEPASSLSRSQPPPLRILDLACGKGALAVEIARRLPSRITGVDACTEFLRDARALADHHGVAPRCRFLHADVRAFARTRPRFDVALMIGLFPIAHAAPLLRAHVRPGGLYILDDAVLQPRHPLAHVYEGVPDIVDCTAAISHLGDRILHRVTLPRAAVASQSATIHARLASAAAALAKSHPGLAPSLRAFVGRHRDAAAVLIGPLRPTIFVVRRVQS